MTKITCLQPFCFVGILILSNQDVINTNKFSVAMSHKTVDQ